MREIKFLAWDKSTKQMCRVINLGAFMGSVELGTIVDREGTTRFGQLLDRELGEVELMQFTGLKDKNGRDLYEGYVVRFRSHPEAISECKIIWDEKSARFMADRLDGGGWSSFQHFNHLEVIGNIYENPELLK